MHHPRSISAVRRLRLASLLLLANHLLIATGAATLLVSLLVDDRGLMIFGLMSAIIGVQLVFSQWVAASHAGCPLCRTPVLAPMRCMKHRQARPLLGSYRLRVAVAIIFKKRFRCPYCNETTAVEVRETLRGLRPRGYDAPKTARFH